MCIFTDVCACELRRREVNEACRCACPDGIASSKVSTSDDACDDHFLISAKSVTLLSRPLSTSIYTNFAQLKVSDSKVRDFGLGLAYRSRDFFGLGLAYRSPDFFGLGLAYRSPDFFGLGLAYRSPDS